MLLSFYYSLFNSKKSLTHWSNGFSLVEVLVASVLLASSLAAVARISSLALNGQRLLGQRRAIEAAINEDILTLQSKNAAFTSANVGDADALRTACVTPAATLATQLGPFLDLTVDLGSGNSIKVSRSTNSAFNPNLLRVEYNFTAPEENIGNETRVIEMTPYFSADCLPS
ncbi:MAG: type IV pilus modification PilV family protein [Synechococcus sp.]